MSAPASAAESLGMAYLDGEGRNTQIRDFTAFFLATSIMCYLSFATKKYEYIIYENKLNKSKNFVIKKGKFNSNKSIRVRVVSTKLNNSKLVFKNLKIKKSFQYLSKFSNFVLIIINNEKGDKNEKEKVILRYYGIGAQIIKDLRVKNMILVTKTRKKIIGLEGF